MVDHCIISSWFMWNGFHVFAIMNLSIFWQNLQFFFHIFWHLLSLFKLFYSQGPKKFIRVWIISYWKIFFSCHGIGFNFWMSQIIAIFFDKISIFFRFLTILVIFFSFSSFRDQAIFIAQNFKANGTYNYCYKIKGKQQMFKYTKIFYQIS